ncbi:MAG: chemotaxis protein CheA [Verrucomicrobiota bacterium]|jgi:two-component system chemotaxis sensor kinase CheA
MNDNLQQQLIKDLLIESLEGLDNFDREILALEKGAGSAETLNNVFRTIHTIKGSSGCIGLNKIESVAHVGESLLSLLRDGQLAFSPAMSRALLEYSDALKEMLRSLEQTGKQGEVDYSALLQKLQSLQTSQPPEVQPPAAFGLFEEEPPVPAAAPPVVDLLAKPAPANLPAMEPVSVPGKAAVEKEVAARPATSISDTAIRVDVGQLDKLMNLVGELVLARNQIVQFTAQAQEPTLLNAAQRINTITTELQESVMKTRMQPIGNVWARFPRIVHDMAQDLGKRVELVLEGKETDLDRTIIEAIKDPLTHLIRNAVDHGIETPEERRAAGKPEQGTLTLRAFHEGGQVNIEILDNGRGINLAKVKEKAVQRSLMTPDQAAVMSEREVFNLIFLPGFSTADKVTNVSGRGVGMDVVKTNIEKIGGSVDVLSEAGQGTTLKIKIPLTLAIIPALIVTSGAERFAIPQVSLLELVRLEAEQARKGIEMLYGAPIYRLRGQLLPLAYLNRELKLEAPASDVAGSSAGDAVVNIVVLQADGRQFGMVVDEINDTEEIVVKPLGKQLKGITCFAGATIMGDGRVALILDVMGLAQHANVIAEVRDRAVAGKMKNAEKADERQTLLLFNAGQNTRMAIPLSMVARLEEFARAQVEHSGGQEVVQYRGQILPLIQVANYLPNAAAAPVQTDPVQVVVYSESGRSVGLVVGKINDIVHEAITVKRNSSRDGILGSAVVQDKVTDLLDVIGIIRAAEPTFYDTKKA